MVGLPEDQTHFLIQVSVLNVFFLPLQLGQDEIFISFLSKRFILLKFILCHLFLYFFITRTFCTSTFLTNYFFFIYFRQCLFLVLSDLRLRLLLFIFRTLHNDASNFHVKTMQPFYRFDGICCWRRILLFYRQSKNLFLDSLILKKLLWH